MEGQAGWSADTRSTVGDNHLSWLDCIGFWRRGASLGDAMVNRVTYWMLHALIAATGLSVCAYLYNDLIAYKPPIAYLSGSDVYPKRVTAGDTIEVTRRFTVTNSQVIRISRALVRGDCKTSCTAYDLEPSISTLNAGTYTRTRTHHIPTFVQPGEYRLEFYVSWQNFIGHTFSMQLPPLEIEVVK